MFNFKITTHKLNELIYFFIPAEISQLFSKGDSVKLRFRNIGSFEKKLGQPREYKMQNIKRRLFFVIIPKDFTAKNNIKSNKEYEVHIEEIK